MPTILEQASTVATVIGSFAVLMKILFETDGTTELEELGQHLREWVKGPYLFFVRGGSNVIIIMAFFGTVWLYIVQKKKEAVYSRKRIFDTNLTVSLNIIEGGKLEIPTLQETSIGKMFPEEGLRNRIEVLKSTTTEDNPFLLLTSNEDKNWFGRMADNACRVCRICSPDTNNQGDEITKGMLNFLSTLSASGHLQHVMGAGVKKEEFYYALTYEKPSKEFPEIASKHRVMLLRSQDFENLATQIWRDESAHDLHARLKISRRRDYLQLWAKILREPTHKWHESLKRCKVVLAIPDTSEKIANLEGLIQEQTNLIQEQTNLIKELKAQLSHQPATSAASSD